MIWNLIGSIGGKVLDIVDDVVEDKDEANRLKFEIQRQLIENKSSELEAAAKIVLAEAQGGWLQRNWRPLLMVTFAGLVVAHWFGFTAPDIPESVQNSYGLEEGSLVSEPLDLWAGKIKPPKLSDDLDGAHPPELIFLYAQLTLSKSAF